MIDDNIISIIANVRALLEPQVNAVILILIILSFQEWVFLLKRGNIAPLLYNTT